MPETAKGRVCDIGRSRRLLVVRQAGRTRCVVEVLDRAGASGEAHAYFTTCAGLGSWSGTPSSVLGAVFRSPPWNLLVVVSSTSSCGNNMTPPPTVRRQHCCAVQCCSAKRIPGAGGSSTTPYARAYSWWAPVLTEIRSCGDVSLFHAICRTLTQETIFGCRHPGRPHFR